MRLPTLGVPQDVTPESSGARRIQNAFAVALILLFIALTWLSRDPTDVGGADELEYRALSQSIEQGSYREIYQPDAPRAIKYPPVFPLWQVGLRAITGDHLDGVIVANILFTAIAYVLIFLIVRQIAGGWLALGSLGLLAINEPIIEFTGAMLSEPMYILTTTLALSAAYAAQRGRARMAGAAIAFALMAFLTRSAGITMVASIGAWVLLGRRRADIVAFVVASAIVVGGWFAYTSSVPTVGATSYMRDLDDAQRNEGSNSAAAGIVSRVSRKAIELSTRTFTVSLGVPTVEGTVIDNAVWLGALLVFLPLGLLVLFRSWPAMVLYVVFYSGLLLMWPYSNSRIVCVVIPFMIPAYLVGARALARLLPGKLPALAMGCLLVAMTAGALPATLELYEEGAYCSRENRAPFACYDTRDHAFIRANAYLATQMKPDDISVSSKAPSAFFLTGRLSVPSRLILNAPGNAVDELRARRARFVILSSYFAGEDGGLAEKLLRQCGQLKVEMSDLPESLVLSVLPAGQSSDDACQAIPRFLRTIVRAAG